MHPFMGDKADPSSIILKGTLSKKRTKLQKKVGNTKTFSRLFEKALSVVLANSVSASRPLSKKNLPFFHEREIFLYFWFLFCRNIRIYILIASQCIEEYVCSAENYHDVTHLEVSE